MAAEAVPQGDNCWLCSKPLDPAADPGERVCPHCFALNKPRSAAEVPLASNGEASASLSTEERCRLCLQPLDTSAENHRRTCANCGEVNRPDAQAPEDAPLDAEALEQLERRHRRLYGWTLGLVPGATGALVSLLAIAVVTHGRNDDWVVGAIASFIYMAIASACALLWKLLRTSVGRGDVAAGAGSGFGISVVGTAAVIGLVIVLKSVLR